MEIAFVSCLLQIYVKKQLNQMGNFFSNEINHSIDVSGHNNRVLMLCGAPINISVILHDFTEHIVRENRKMIVNVALVSVVVSVMLIMTVVWILLSCYMKQYQEDSNMLGERIFQQIYHVQKLLIIDKTTTNMNHCGLFNKKKSVENSD